MVVCEVIQEEDKVPNNHSGMTIIDILEETRREEQAEDAAFGLTAATEMRFQRYTQMRENREKRLALEQQEREEREERDRFFNLPSAEADFEYWSKLDLWSLDEATALSLNKNPRIVNLDLLQPHVASSPFALEYGNRFEMARRAAQCGLLRDPCAPSEYLNWAVRKDFLLPMGLREHVAKFGDDQLSELQQAKELIVKLTSECDTLRVGLEELQAEVVSQSKRPEAIAKEQLSMNIIIYAATTKRYRFDTAKERNTATAVIMRDINDCGLELDDQTILKVLRNAASEVQKKLGVKSP